MQCEYSCRPRGMHVPTTQHGRQQGTQPNRRPLTGPLQVCRRQGGLLVLHPGDLQRGRGQFLRIVGTGVGRCVGTGCLHASLGGVHSPLEAAHRSPGKQPAMEQGSRQPGVHLVGVDVACIKGGLAVRKVEAARRSRGWVGG